MTNYKDSIKFNYIAPLGFKTRHVKMCVKNKNFPGRAWISLESTNNGFNKVRKSVRYALKWYKNRSTRTKSFTFIPSKHRCGNGQAFRTDYLGHQIRCIWNPEKHLWRKKRKPTCPAYCPTIKATCCPTYCCP